MKIVINNCYGGFSLSPEAFEVYKEKGGTCDYHRNILRDDPYLIEVVEELREKANGPNASLRIAEVPDGVTWQIEEYDGNEWVAEAHRTWR